jgi:hypothetical protein
MYHSKTSHVASGFFVRELITQPVAVIVGSRCLPCFQVGAISNREFFATSPPESLIIPRNQ